MPRRRGSTPERRISSHHATESDSARVRGDVRNGKKETMFMDSIRDMSHMTVVELKEALRWHGLSVRGRKRELVDRLANYISESEPMDVEEAKPMPASQGLIKSEESYSQQNEEGVKMLPIGVGSSSVDSIRRRLTSSESPDSGASNVDVPLLASSSSIPGGVRRDNDADGNPASHVGGGVKKQDVSNGPMSHADRSSIGLLFVLYTLQGVPMGLAATVPIV